MRSVAVLLSHCDDNGDYSDCGAGWLPLETLKGIHREKKKLKVLNIQLRMQIENQQTSVVWKAQCLV